jgi:hypothetical protein
MPSLAQQLLDATIALPPWLQVPDPERYRTFLDRSARSSLAHVAVWDATQAFGYAHDHKLSLGEGNCWRPCSNVSCWGLCEAEIIVEGRLPAAPPDACVVYARQIGPIDGLVACLQFESSASWTRNAPRSAELHKWAGDKHAQGLAPRQMEVGSAQWMAHLL